MLHPLLPRTMPLRSSSDKEAHIASPETWKLWPFLKVSVYSSLRKCIQTSCVLSLPPSALCPGVVYTFPILYCHCNGIPKSSKEKHVWVRALNADDIRDKSPSAWRMTSTMSSDHHNSWWTSVKEFSLCWDRAAWGNSFPANVTIRVDSGIVYGGFALKTERQSQRAQAMAILKKG